MAFLESQMTFAPLYIKSMVDEWIWIRVINWTKTYTEDSRTRLGERPVPMSFCPSQIPGYAYIWSVTDGDYGAWYWKVSGWFRSADFKVGHMTPPPPGPTGWRKIKRPQSVVYQGGGGWGVHPPPPRPKFRRPSKIVPSSTLLWKLLKIAEFRMPTHQDVGKKRQ